DRDEGHAVQVRARTRIRIAVAVAGGVRVFGRVATVQRSLTVPRRRRIGGAGRVTDAEVARPGRDVGAPDVGLFEADAAELAVLRIRPGGRVPVALHHLQVVRAGLPRGRFAAFPGHLDGLVDQVLGLADRYLEILEVVVHEGVGTVGIARR